MIRTQNEEMKSSQGEYNVATSSAGTRSMFRTKDQWLGGMAEVIACGLDASTYRERLKPGVTFKPLYANATRIYSTELSIAGFRVKK